MGTALYEAPKKFIFEIKKRDISAAHISNLIPQDALPDLEACHKL